MRTLEIKLSRDTIVSQVAAFLYAVGVLHDDEEVKDIQFGEFGTETVPLKIQIKKEQEVKVFRFT